MDEAEWGEKPNLQKEDFEYTVNIPLPALIAKNKEIAELKKLVTELYIGRTQLIKRISDLETTAIKESK